MNKYICHEIFLDTIIDGLKYFHDENNLNNGIECIIELIERMKNLSNSIWQNILRLKHKMIFKLIKNEYSQVKTRIFVSKFIVQ